ncbi:hypothetical protein K3727_12050 [Rhodobacteraceae bacterium M382]|nr:hypothetical protein K3727_12050 [Rhodobacteraceae bacterium M382]
MATAARARRVAIILHAMMRDKTEFQAIYNDCGEQLDVTYIRAHIQDVRGRA